MAAESVTRKTPEGYTAHLIRLVQACGDTLKNHAAEIVGTKAGTTSFQIIIELPRIQDFEAVFPDIKVIQTYVSDEALKVEMERAYGDRYRLDDAAPSASPETEGAADD